MVIPAGGRARPLLRHPYPARKPQPCPARVPSGAAPSPTPTSSRPIAGCAAAFSRYRGSQRLVPICLPSSCCPAPRHVENLSPPAISRRDNQRHRFNWATAVTSLLDGLPVRPAPRRAAAVWGSSQTPVSRGLKLWWPGARRNGETPLLLLSGPVPGMLSHD